MDNGNTFEAQHKIGNQSEDIKNIYIHANAKNEIDRLYVLYNNGTIERIVKSKETKYKDFKSNVIKYLEQAGANNTNREHWGVLNDQNQTVDFNALDEKYYDQEGLKNANKEYRRFKVKVVKDVMNTQVKELKEYVANALSSGILTLAAVMASNDNSIMTKPFTIAAVASYIFTIRSHIRFQHNLVEIIKNKRKAKEEKQNNLIEEKQRLQIEQKTNTKEDINKVILLSELLPDKKTKLQKVYIEYNNGQLDIIEKNNKTQEEFVSNMQEFMKSIGANNENRGSKWFSCLKNNKFGIDFDELDKRYEEQQKEIASKNRELPAVVNNKIDIQSALNSNLAELKKEAKEKKTSRYKIKKISDVFSPEKEHFVEAAMRTIWTAAAGTATLILASNMEDLTVIPTLLGGIVTFIEVLKTSVSYDKVNGKKMRKNLKTYFLERLKRNGNDLKDNTINRIKEDALNNIENPKTR